MTTIQTTITLYIIVSLLSSFTVSLSISSTTTSTLSTTCTRSCSINKKRQHTTTTAANASANTNTNHHVLIKDEFYHVRNLNISDVEYIHNHYKNTKKKTSIHKIRHIIQYNSHHTFGIENTNNNHNNILIGWILRYHNKSWGMLYVHESYRQKGLGSYLLSLVTNICCQEEENEQKDEEHHHKEHQQQDQHYLNNTSTNISCSSSPCCCFAYIMDNNIASQNLFRKHGWVPQDSNVKKGTGKRRAKRKWIYSKSTTK